MQNRFLLFILFLTAYTPLCSAQDIFLRRGASKIINLEENPSTGYRWIITPTVESKHTVIRINDLGFTPKHKMPGSPGVHKWRLIAQEKGRLILPFEYKRVWETEVVKDLNIVIVVD